MTHPSQNSRKLRIAVLVSGGGTNLQALIDRSAEGALNAEIVVVASDRADAYGLVRAAKAGIPHHVVDYASILKGDSPHLSEKPCGVDLVELDAVQKILRIADPKARLDRLERLVRAEQALIQVLDPYEPDLVCLAGFMRLVSPYFIRRYNHDGAWRILNIHPALLPAFPGRHGYEDTFNYGCRWGGITVHFVDQGEDTGPILAQAVYPVWPDDTVEDVRSRGLALEYEAYGQCIQWLADGQVHVDGSTPRPKVTITDPAYPRILKSWAERAFQRPQNLK